MKKTAYVIAVVGATSVLGRELQAVLRERGFPVREWRLFVPEESLGEAEDETFEGRLELLDGADFSGVDLAFMAAAEALSATWTPRAVAAGGVVIDLSQVFAEDVEVPIVVPEVNPGAVAEHAARRVLTSPVPGATALAVVLKPLEEAARVKRVVVAAYEPVSSAGQAGIEELSRQTSDLLSGRAEPPAVFPHRVAFNLIPQVGEFLAAGVSRGEWQVEAQTRRLLGRLDLPISVTGVRVPTFFGHGYAVNVETERPLDAAGARELLRGERGILLVDDPASKAYPTLVDAVGAEATYVGRIRDDPSVRSGLNLWVTIDGTRKGGAVNAAQIAELLIRDYL